MAGVRAKVGRRAGSRTLVGALLQLLVVGRLLDDIKDGDRQRSVREREGLGVGFSLRAERGTRFNERTAAEMCPICRGCAPRRRRRRRTECATSTGRDSPLSCCVHVLLEYPRGHAAPPRATFASARSRGGGPGSWTHETHNCREKRKGMRDPRAPALLSHLGSPHASDPTGLTTSLFCVRVMCRGPRLLARVPLIN